MSTVYSVFQISNYIKNMFRQDILLSGRVMVQGEVSNCKDHSTGLYFTLKDDQAVLNCTMFRRAADGLKFTLRPGDRVIVTGTVDTYLKGGNYRLYASKIERAGSGDLYEEYLKLKKKLEELGLFDPAYKQEIPAFARKIGIVTAPAGAVIQDIMNVAKRRHPGIELFLYPSLVQGDKAPAELIRGIETLDEMGLDVLIVGRGGGSLEDLWAFNDEGVAHAIFNTRTPVISAVGHETDWTIADFVADLRAPTPSAAAELAVPDVTEWLERIHQMEIRMNSSMNSALALSRRNMREYQALLKLHSPENMLRLQKEKLSGILRILDERMNRAVEKERGTLGLLAGRLDGASPLKKLSQGYTFTSDRQGKAIRSVSSVRPGDEIVVHASDGRILAGVKETIPEG